MLHGGETLNRRLAHDEILEELAEILVHNAGYLTDAVVRNYAYADYLGAAQVVRRADLAAFAETPPSYRSACVAVARLNEDRDTESVLAPLIALGAPRVIVLGPARTSVWTLRATGDPERVGDHPTAEISRVIRTEVADWSPQAILRLGGVARPGPYQLDFADLGLVPMIERQVNAKVDRLIQEVLTGCLERDPSLDKRQRFSHLVRMVFGLLAAKVLVDRKHPELAGPLSTASSALETAQRHYGISKPPRSGRVPIAAQICDWAWERIQRSFHFQNLSVDALAFVYENSLVSPEVRQRLGIHGTPRAIAELVVDLLPLEELPKDRDVILEPCSGFGPFLLAALRRLRSRSLPGLDPAERHKLLVRRLRGIELDTFAVEVGRLCLTLADYPNADGWHLIQNDVFAPGALEGASQQVGAVLANPPFEAFEEPDRQRYEAVYAEKPIELLRRVLAACTPDLLGMVVPRVVIDSQRSNYRQLRGELKQSYREIDVVYLPDTVFEYSDVESVLLIARFRRSGDAAVLRNATVKPSEIKDLLQSRWQLKWRVARVTSDPDEKSNLSVDELSEIWDYLGHLPRLGNIAHIHRGIEYLELLGEVPGRLISDQPKLQFSKGVHRAEDIHAYRLVRSLYLNTDPEKIRCGKNHPWSRPKVIVNAARRQRGLWPLSAVPDPEGLWCYQNLFGIWLSKDSGWPLEVITALLNGPVANAFVAMRSNKRAIQQHTLLDIPLPSLSRLDISRIIDLVHHATEKPDSRTILQIDAEILRGYDLPPRLERRLLNLFEGENRAGVEGFCGFYPPDFDSALPLHKVLSGLGEPHRAAALLETVPVFHDPTISEMFDEIAIGFAE